MVRKFSLIITLIILLIGIGLLPGCFQSRSPLGADHEIRVVADSTLWYQAEPILRELFEKVEYTPQPEKVFKIIRADLSNYKQFKNIIFLSTLDSDDKISTDINSRLSEDARKKVDAGNIMFVRKDEWASYQVVMFLIGKDLPTLLSQISEQRSQVFFQFDDYWRNLHEEILYNYKEQIDVEKHLLKNYGWMVRVPLDFKLITQSSQDRFVMFLRKLPYRWFSVFWVEATDPGIISKEWCIAKRNEIGKTFYDNESVEEIAEPVRTEEVIFLNRNALKLKGLWKNDSDVDPAGGPFRMYCFFDEPTERIYFIDMHLFSPDFKKRKIHYLRQMEIMANTFKTNLEVKPGEL